MKRWFLVILCAMLIFSTCAVTTASADTMYANTWTATVISTNVSIRESADTRSTRLYKAKNMDELAIIGEYYDWYVVDCYRSGLSPVEQTGYVLKRFVVLNGYYIQLTGQSIDVYSDPWSGKCNGQKATAGETLFVIYETDQWLVCQLKTQEHTPGSCFVRKSDVYGYTSYEEPKSPTSGQSMNGYYDFSNPNNYPLGFKGTYTGNEYTNYIAEWKIRVDRDYKVGIRAVPDKDTKCLIIIRSRQMDYYNTGYIKVNVIYDLGQYDYVRIDDPGRPGGYIEGYVQEKYFESY